MTNLFRVAIEKNADSHIYTLNGEEKTLEEILLIVHQNTPPLIHIVTKENGVILLEGYIPSSNMSLFENRLKRAAKAQI